MSFTEISVFIGILVFCIITIVAFFQYKQYQYDKYKQEQKKIMENLVSLIKVRNETLAKELNNYSKWLSAKYPQEAIEVILGDKNLYKIKEQYKIKDTDFIMSFQTSIGALQQIHITKIQDILEEVSNNAIKEIKKQLGEL